MEKRLSDLKIGERCKVISVSGERKIKRRLYDMGVTPSVEIYVRKRAPLGDPIEINLRSYELTLRLSEASSVLVEVI